MSGFPSLLGQLMRAAHSGKAHLAHSQGLEPGGFFILGKIIANGPIRSAALAEMAFVDASLVSRQTQQLVAKGYVERVADPTDGRASLLRVTDAGREFHELQHGVQCSFFDRVFKDWSTADRSDLERLLTRLVADLNHELSNLPKNQEVHSTNE